ncbi:MAG TPA: hypothetical protein VK489_08740 [Ferruginibacter sp.]|nr:hypothetical protein [Ferruginibacter sp.]
MKQTIKLFDRYFDGSALVSLGYRDYVAARVLLNNKLIIQGITLASTAVEKYLKAVIVLTLKEKERFNYHFDRIEKLQDILDRNHHDITKNFDPVFLSILEKAFKIRYYDGLKKPVTISFYLNQFLGELDQTIYNLEKLINLGLAYSQAVKSKDPHLFENNFILRKQDKKEFMEKPDTAFSVYIDMCSSTQRENTMFGSDIVNKYEGRLAVFEDPFEPKW